MSEAHLLVCVTIIGFLPADEYFRTEPEEVDGGDLIFSLKNASSVVCLSFPEVGVRPDAPCISVSSMHISISYSPTDITERQR